VFFGVLRIDLFWIEIWGLKKSNKKNINCCLSSCFLVVRMIRKVSEIRELSVLHRFRSPDSSGILPVASLATGRYSV
jgi:hypothetical protein